MTAYIVPFDVYLAHSDEDGTLCSALMFATCQIMEPDTEDGRAPPVTPQVPTVPYQ